MVATEVRPGGGARVRRLPASVRRSAHHGLVLTAVAVTVLLAATVLAALAALAGNAVDQGAGVRLAADPRAQVQVSAGFQTTGLAAADRAVRSATAQVFGGVPEQTYLGLLGVGPLIVNGASNGKGAVLHPVAVQGAARYGRLVSGAWPAGTADVPSTSFTTLPTVSPGVSAPGASSTVDAALPQQLAQLLGVRPGARLTLGDAFGRPVTVRVTGVYTAQGNAGFWPGMAGDPTAAQGAANSLFVVSPAALNGTAALNGQVTAYWSAQGDFAGAAANQLAGLRDRAGAFAGSHADLSVFHGAQPPLSRMTVVSSLPQAVDALAAPIAVARSALYQPTALLAVLALTALILTARQLAEHRSGELALQQARGAGTGRLLAAAGVEWGLTGIPAAVAAPFLAQFLVHGALGPAGWTAAVLTLAVQGAAVLLPVLHPALRPLFRRISIPRRRDTRRRTGAVAVQRAGLDLALAVVALLGWLELAHHHAVVQGASVAAGPVSVPAVDPVLVLAPVVACVAASLLLFRLMPLTSRLLDRYGRRRAGLVLPLAGWQLSRRSARNAGPVLLMCLAAAVGALSGTALACLDGLALDQARFTVGADVRVDTSAGGGYAPSVLADAYRALPGVTAVTPVTLTPVTAAAGTTLQIVGTDTGTATTPDGLPLPGRPSALRLDETLTSNGAKAAPTLELTLQDASGLTDSVNAALPDADGGRHTVTVPLPVNGSGHPRDYPLTLTSITLVPQAGQDAARLRLVLHRIGSSPGTGPDPGTAATDWAGVLPPGLAWADRTVSAGGARTNACDTNPASASSDLFQPGPPGVCSLTSDASDTSDPGGLFSATISTGVPEMKTDPGSRIRIAVTSSAPAAPVPVLADPRALAALHHAVGDTVSLDLGSGRSMAVRITGSVAAVPGLGSTRTTGWFTADQRTLAAALAAAGVDQQPPTLWRLTSTDSARTAAAVTAQPALGSAQTVAQSTAQLRGDPFRSGLRRVLTLCRLLAPAFAVIGFTVHAVVSTRERRREFALLRAMGARSRSLATLLWAEQLSIALFAVVPGALLGTALAAQVLPLITVDDSGRPPFPPLRVRVPWGGVALSALGTAALICLVVMALSRLLARVDLVRVLRAGESA
ncbi:FtsX-like permease family protein [Streptomyces sp. 846.5]|nr:ABC transporter permease [Streptomyces sp. 846.5]TDU03039.1 FtsX-like permease family protein [Streptomyces sp. 846.5]